jgi:hypothetical protein
MKKFGFYALAAASLLFAACSSSDDVTDSPQNPTDEIMDGAYIGVSIQLPNDAASTRANEDFEDGETDEFSVKNATLYIFRSADGTEDNATFFKSYTIGTDYSMDGGSNVTSTYTNAVKLDNTAANEIKSDATNTYFAYVIVNHNNVLTAEPTTWAAFKDMAFDAARIGNAPAAEKNITAQGLLMTNAPVSKNAGGTAAATTAAADYTTLVVLDKSKIYATEADARKNAAACVFVERAAVKITVSESVATQKVGDYPYEFDGWQIFNYAPTFYNTRHVDAAWGNYASQYLDATATDYKDYYQYRFVSPTGFDPKLPTPHTGPFRTYWATDLTYNADATLQKPQAPVDGTWIDFGKSGYTTENTFDVEHQTWQNTTQVAVRAQFNGGDPFFMVARDETIYDQTNAQNKVQSLIANVPEISGLLEEACRAISQRTTGNPTITSSLTVAFTVPTAGKDNIEYTVTPKFEGGELTDADKKGDDKYSDLIAAAIAAVKPNFTVNYYAGGHAYYAARIKHFGDYETPWSATGAYIKGSGEVVTDIYGDPVQTKDFLGRYGVVRDNWYNLSVDGVTKIGSAEPVNVTGKGTPDDEVENYISVHVHIVPWVIRNQHITF